MSVWDTYPADYRSTEVQSILKAVNAGECVSIVGLSGAGKSNLLGFLAHRVDRGPRFLLIDCNELPSATSQGLYMLLTESLGCPAPASPTLASVIEAVARELELHPSGLCLLLDRFDAFNTPSADSAAVAANLRSIRDHFKYNLTYVTATRTPVELAGELSELLSGNTLWLGPLNKVDALWSIAQYATRKNLAWDSQTLERIFSLSGGYPSMLRAVCEAFSAGIPLETSAMRNSTPVKLRVDEFWADSPLPEHLHQSHLESNLLLAAGAPLRIDAADLTAAEQHLLDYFIAHPGEVCTKDALIQAVWPDEKLVAGLRDDSLAQLVHRLREKLDTSDVKHIQTIPGRGYRYQESPI